MSLLIEAVDPRSDADREAGPPAVDVRDDWGRLLWFHPVLQFETDLPLESDELRAVAKPFDSRYTRQTVSFPYGLFVPGINLSTLVVQRAFRGLRPTPMMLTVLNWAYLALFIGIDRSLLATVEHDALAEEESLDDLQTKADAMFVIYSDVRKARARLDSVLNDLGGGELALWQAIADVQKWLSSSFGGDVAA